MRYKNTGTTALIVRGKRVEPGDVIELADNEPGLNVAALKRRLAPAPKKKPSTKKKDDS